MTLRNNVDFARRLGRSVDKIIRGAQGARFDPFGGGFWEGDLARRAAEGELAFREAQRFNGGGGLGGAREAFEARKQREADNRRLDLLINTFLEAQTRANAANEQRFQQALGETRATNEANLADLEGVGTQRSADIGQAFREQGARIGQDLASRGLVGSTARIAPEVANQREAQSELSRLSEQLALLRTQERRTGADRLAGIIERREDVAPSFESLISLLLNSTR